MTYCCIVENKEEKEEEEIKTKHRKYIKNTLAQILVDNPATWTPESFNQTWWIECRKTRMCRAGCLYMYHCCCCCCCCCRCYCRCFCRSPEKSITSLDRKKALPIAYIALRDFECNTEKKNFFPFVIIRFMIYFH